MEEIREAGYKIDFIVKKEEGRVIAILRPFNIYETVKDLYENNIHTIKLIGKDKLLNKKYVGVAVLSGDDEWDEEKGKEIAKTKAKIKYLNHKARIFTKALENPEIAIVKRLIDVYERKADKLLDILNKF